MAPARNRLRWIAAAGLFLACLTLTAILAFAAGKRSAEQRSEIQTANDCGFLSFCALKALEEPESEKWRTLFQVNLDAMALQLAEISISRPELIGNTNYNLLVQIRRYLQQPPGRAPGLRPLEQVTAKLDEAIARLRSLHPDVERWEAQESGWPEAADE